MDFMMLVSGFLASAFMAYGLMEVRRSKMRKVRAAMAYRAR
jgi:hypothetical protein